MVQTAKVGSSMTTFSNFQVIKEAPASCRSFLDVLHKFGRLTATPLLVSKAFVELIEVHNFVLPPALIYYFLLKLWIGV